MYMATRHPSTRRRRRPRTIALAVTVALACLATACGNGSDARSSAASGATGTTGTTGTTETKAIPRPPSKIGWTGCGERLDCATVSVPLDWSRPDQDMIELAVIRHSASRADQRVGTIFVNPGGPGDTGVGLVRDAGDELDQLAGGRFDIIGWDPRGTHASSPVRCFANDADEAAFWAGASIPTTSAESEAYVARTRDLARRCGEVMGPLLSHISSTDTVRDLDALRELAGEETITYVGLSYGTFLGQLYANLFPQRVRAMYLDSIVDPVAFTTSAESRVTADSSSADEVWEQFFTLCDDAGQRRCALAGHGESTKARVDRLFEASSKGPIPAPTADPPGDLVHSELLVSSFAPLRSPELWPDYAKALDAAVDGDASALATSARQATGPKSFTEGTKSSAISCLDGPATEPVAAWSNVIGGFVERSRTMGPTLGWWLWAPCASNWPAHSDDRYTGPWNARTATPILLVNNRYDPNTGFQNAVKSEKLLDNAVLLTNRGYGHLTAKDPSACVEQAVERYLVDLVTPPPGTECTADKLPFA